MNKTAIEWTNMTWNPVTGCDKISPGCKNCYAERFAHRLQAMNNPRYKNGFKVTLHWDKIEEPLSWKKPRLVFVNSMSDLFHTNVTFEFILQIFNVMVQAKQHVFQVLTKRPERLLKFADRLPWPRNVWLGVSIENQDYVWRLDLLKKSPAKTKFISFEPLIGQINVDQLSLQGINWVIVGGESGPGARELKSQWVRDIRDKCLEENIPFFFKQWGGFTPKSNGRQLDGQEWSQYPEYKVVGNY